jgi:hypothetical protein
MTRTTPPTAAEANKQRLPAASRSCPPIPLQLHRLAVFRQTLRNDPVEFHHDGSVIARAAGRGRYRKIRRVRSILCAVVAVFQSILITVVGVETGELVTFNQAIDGGLSVVTANAAGVAVIPALLAVRSVNENAALTRANRTALGNVGTAGAIFQRVAMLQTPGAISHQLSGDSFSATITTTFANGATQVMSVSDLGVVQLSAAQVGASASAQAAIRPRSPAVDASASPSATVDPQWTIQIPGLVKVLPVPGLQNAPVAIAELSDGTNLVLSREPDGCVRMAGMVPRWLDMPAVSGRWAISSSTGDRVAVLAVRPFGSPKCCCGCHTAEQAARR